MILNITYGANVENAPEGFKTTVAAVTQFFQTTFTDPVTINIKVEYAHLGSGLLGHSDYNLNQYTYAQITNALKADANSNDDASAAASLPAADPISGTHVYVMTTAQAKALGLPAPNNSAFDGTAAFANNQPFDFDRSNGITAGQYDFYGSVAHEFSEIMGRELNAIGNLVQTGEPNGYYPFDLFKYSAAGAHEFVGTKAGYFSLNGGVTNLNNFNTDPDDDFGDWAASAGNDSFLAFSNSGVVNAVTATDIAVMDILGWDAKGAPGTVTSSDGTAVVGRGGGRFAPPHVDGSGGEHPIDGINPAAHPVPHADTAHVTTAEANPGHHALDWFMV
jgi:hypothetical protein